MGSGPQSTCHGYTLFVFVTLCSVLEDFHDDAKSAGGHRLRKARQGLTFSAGPMMARRQRGLAQWVADRAMAPGSGRRAPGTFGIRGLGVGYWAPGTGHGAPGSGRRGPSGSGDWGSDTGHRNRARGTGRRASSLGIRRGGAAPAQGERPIPGPRPPNVPGPRLPDPRSRTYSLPNTVENAASDVPKAFAARTMAT